jgi:hypothetical protein
MEYEHACTGQARARLDGTLDKAKNAPVCASIGWWRLWEMMPWLLDPPLCSSHNNALPAALEEIAGRTSKEAPFSVHVHATMVVPIQYLAHYVTKQPAIQPALAALATTPNAIDLVREVVTKYLSGTKTSTK